MKSSPVKSIYAVHQGHELYGSDRVFIRSLKAFRAQWPNADIRVVLPKYGALYDSLAKENYQITVRDLWVLRKSLGWKILSSLLRLPRSIWTSCREMAKSDIAYISTSVLLDHMIAARFVNTPSVIHVHEYPANLFAGAFRFLLAFSGAHLIFISRAVANRFRWSVSNRSAIIYNGHEVPLGEVSPPGSHKGAIRILLLGRISAWKGQGLLVEAVSRLPPNRRAQLRVRIIGDVYGDSDERAKLVDAINRLDLKATVTVEPFMEDASSAYQWSDVVVVPSTSPEPFGLVAIEAMSWGRPVIAASHGGLAEIVLGGATGYLVEPNDPASLAEALERYLRQRELMSLHGIEGRARYVAVFTAGLYSKALRDFMSKAVKGDA